MLPSPPVGNTPGIGPIEPTVTVASGQEREAGPQILPALHRSSSTLSLSNERQLLDHRLRHLHHRGSLY
ncbi:GL25499 [Drosophila persimilis]|uniref:GL25499 n=1 Tax=Drosophila persimilis TaxID=7234 RepID=B4GU94_DROPE|nr:GL25499 [Drosophila persimilis]